MTRWAEAIEVESRKVQAALLQHGIQATTPSSARRTTPPCTSASAARRVEGMGAAAVAEQREHGYASQQPEFVLRRPKVIVTE